MPRAFDLLVEDEQNLRVRADVTVFYCPAENATFCLLRHLQLELPIKIDEAGTNEVVLMHQLPSAEEIDRSIESGSG